MKPANLLYGQPYGYVHTPQDEMIGGADGVTMTKDGSLLVATKLGIQIMDPPGRVHAILSRPTSRRQVVKLRSGRRRHEHLVRHLWQSSVCQKNQARWNRALAGSGRTAKAEAVMRLVVRTEFDP